MRDAIIEVHNQSERHPNGKPHQCQYAQLEDEIDVDGDRDGRYKWKSGR